MSQRLLAIAAAIFLTAIASPATGQVTYNPNAALAPDPAAIEPRGVLTPMTQSAAQSAGNALGSLAAPAVTPLLNSTAPPLLAPNSQGTTATQQSYFVGGWGDIVTPGSSQKSLCLSGGTALPGQASPTDPQCIAADVVATSKQTLPPITITPTDPLITGAQALFANPQLTAGAEPPAYTDCTTSTQTTPGQTTTQICTDQATLGNGACVRPDVVTVKAEYDYQCNVSTAQTTVNTCPQTASVTVTWVPGCAINSLTAGVQSSTTATATCNAANLAQLTITVPEPDWCQWFTSGWCNATYYPLNIVLVKGTPASGSQNMARNYTGAFVFALNWSYDGNETVTVTQPAAGIAAGPGPYQSYGWYVPPVCPAGQSAIQVDIGTSFFPTYVFTCGYPPTLDTTTNVVTCSGPGPYTATNGTCNTVFGSTPSPTTTNSGATWTCQYGWATPPSICENGPLEPAPMGVTYVINGGPVNVPQVSAPTWTDGCTAFEARL